MIRTFVGATAILLLALPAMAAPSDSPEQLEAEQAIQEAMDAAMSEMFRPGPVQRGWDRGGLDIYKLVESAPGGAKGNILLSIDKDGDRSVTIIGAGDPGRIVPKNWKTVIRIGPAQAATGSGSLSISGFDARYFAAERDIHRRVGDGFCSSGTSGSELYENPDATAEGDIPQELIPTFFRLSVQYLEAQPSCWRFDRDGDGYKVTYFLEDGRTLPALNAYNERVTIVPARPVAELLVPRN